MLPIKLDHERLGACELLRVEGTLWVVRRLESGELYRIPSERRREFRLDLAPSPASDGRQSAIGTGARPENEAGQASTESTNAAPALPSATHPEVTAPQRTPVAPPTAPSVAEHPIPGAESGTSGASDERKAGSEVQPSQAFVVSAVETHSEDPRRLRRAFESFRSGLPTTDGCARRLAMGFATFDSHLRPFLGKIRDDGGACLLIKGQYGQGKTYTLQLLEAVALEAGFVTVRAEVDAFENRLDRPHLLYRDLVRRMRTPGTQCDGIETLARLADEHLRRSLKRNTHAERFAWLQEHAESLPIAWLMSDPSFLDKPELLGLLKNELVNGIGQCRRAHAHMPGGAYWPHFRYGTQSDFACLLLSSLGRLTRALGFRGLLVLLDEMEKWQDLRWQEQVRAGSFVGGLIWAANAPKSRRTREHEPKALVHSGASLYNPATRSWVQFDFTTRSRCHLGLAVAMTPRGAAEDPAEYWNQFGEVTPVSLPELTESRLRAYCDQIAPMYSLAYSIPEPTREAMVVLANEACTRWRRDGQLTMRSGVQAAVGVFDEWRGRAGAGGTHA